jgi:hypothetical protein
MMYKLLSTASLSRCIDYMLLKTRHILVLQNHLLEWIFHNNNNISNYMYENVKDCAWVGTHKFPRARTRTIPGI